MWLYKIRFPFVKKKQEIIWKEMKKMKKMIALIILLVTVMSCTELTEMEARRQQRIREKGQVCTYDYKGNYKYCEYER